MHNIPVPPPPQTTAISRDFKKSTAMCKVHNVGLRYIKFDMIWLAIARLPSREEGGVFYLFIRRLPAFAAPGEVSILWYKMRSTKTICPILNSSIYDHAHQAQKTPIRL